MNLRTQILIGVMAVLAFLPLRAENNDVSRIFPKASPPPRVVYDPSTKIAIYLESDGCHVSAIGPAGKLLWCRNFFPAACGIRPKIEKFEAKNGFVTLSAKSINWTASGGGGGSMDASFDEKTGTVITAQES